MSLFFVVMIACIPLESTRKVDCWLTTFLLGREPTAFGVG